MKCVVAGPNVKIFGKAVHTLAKIGDELYLEPLEIGLAVRTVNSSRSAYAGFNFAPSFFLGYETNLAGAGGNDDASRFKGKIAVRSVLFVFKRLTDMDKSVERCILFTDEKESRVVFQLHCKHGIVKTHKLAFIESETLVVNHDKSKAANLIKSIPSVFLDAVSCFQATVDEVVFEPLFDQLLVRNYSDDALTDPSKALSVKLTLDPEEFDVYSIANVAEHPSESNVDEAVNEDRCIRFCLKELRALLAFAESYVSNIAVYFGSAGEPIVFSADSEPGYEADFVLATSTPEFGEGQRERSPGRDKTSYVAPARTTVSTQRRAVLTQPSHRTSAAAAAGNTSYSSSNIDKTKGAHNISTNCDVRICSNGNMDNNASSGQPSFTDSAAAEAKRKATMKKLLGGDSDEDDDSMPTAKAKSGNDCPPPIKVKTTLMGKPRTKASLLCDDFSDDDEVPTTPPTTPPSKKFKALFGFDSQSSSQSSVRTVTVSQSEKDRRESTVLAEDSEGEE